MKNLYLIRHAKSSWADLSLPDEDRPLNARGKRDAPRMAEFLADQLTEVDAFISSPAKRAKATAKHFLHAFGFSKDDLILNKSLYHASIDDIYNVIFGLNDKRDNIFLFGHNPGFTFFANIFTNDAIANVPTCGIVHIKADIKKWSDFDYKSGKLKNFYYPKMFSK
ncbi:MAG: histidine phosphatase family protein [Bacteroidota bacterium]